MNKTILITGATSGIGEATAKYLAGQGYSMVLVARNAEKLAQMKEELPTKVYTYAMDLQKLDEIENIFINCKEFGVKLDGLVHSAGISINGTLKMNSIEDMEKIFRINYEAFIELSKYFSGKKYSNNGSSIVVISSYAAKTCKAGMLNYSTSKAAVNAAVDVLSKELVKRQIRVNSIMPANVRTPLTSHLEEYFNVEQEQPLGGFIEPEYIAYLIEFLLSDKGRYITGAHIPVSAGMN